MPQSQLHYLVITALGTDRAGIVNTITRHVSKSDCNIEDSRLALFGEEFTLIMLLSGTWNAIAQIESTLPLKGAELDLLVVMKRTDASAKRPTPTTLWVEVALPDSPHLIERFTDLFHSQRMNIAELVAKTQPADDAAGAQLYIQITAHAPPDGPLAQIEDRFQQLCTELNAQGSIRIINHPQHQERDGV